MANQLVKDIAVSLLVMPILLTVFEILGQTLRGLLSKIGEFRTFFVTSMDILGFTRILIFILFLHFRCTLDENMVKVSEVSCAISKKPYWLDYIASFDQYS